MLAGLFLSVAAAGIAPVLPIGDFLPAIKDFRSQPIHKLAGEREWPFKASHGLLLCAPSLNQRLVYFVPQNDKGESEFPIMLSVFPMNLALINMGRKDAFMPFENFEQLMKMIFPYLAMGKRLCDQPAGAKLQDSAL